MSSSPASLAEAMERQPLSRNRRMIPTKKKLTPAVHPAMKQAHDAFTAMHGASFARNAGRGFAKKSR